LKRILEKVAIRHNKAAVLAKFQLDMGVLQPSWERLKEFDLDRGVKIQGIEAKCDLWHFVFETYAFVMIMDTSPQSPHESNSRARIRGQLGRKLDEPDFGPLSDRFWHRQLDALRTMMPELATLFPEG
ncbi:hypothetical protein, partial [Mesorhizobium sp. M4A.F.Ca.ET.050.02.1.1]